MKICLNMIVKNESHVIERCLNAVKGHIDSWLIVDTGSTDNTKELIRKTLAGIPGCICEEPWVDFGTNRTSALKLAVKNNNPDYILFIDADEEFRFPAGFKWPELTADAYYLPVQYGGVNYSRCALVSTKRDWVWKGVLHEYLYCGAEDFVRGALDAPVVFVYHEGARARDPDTYKKDALILEKALLDEPNNSRYMFYLAQSYWDCKNFEKSREWYVKRVQAGGWEEEIFYSLYRLGQIEESIGAHPAGAYLTAYEYRPTRAEPLYNLIKFFDRTGMATCADLLRARWRTIPLTKDSLFVEPGAYFGEEAEEKECPVCYMPTKNKKPGTPYYMCPNPSCQCWFQSPPPPKAWHGDHEDAPEAMSEADKDTNRKLAQGLFNNVMGGKPGRTLDVGAAYPVMASELQKLGCEAHAFEGEEVKDTLGVPYIVGDFEGGDVVAGKFDLISFIHVFEHMYDPVKALQKIDSMLNPGGAVFIRIPDHECAGYERDLTVGHYTIHPYFHTLKSIKHAVAQARVNWVVEQTYQLPPGQSDIILRKAGKETKEINLVRPGAIGDIVMTLNCIPALKHKFPEHKINYYCDKRYLGEGNLEQLIRAAGADEVYECEKMNKKAHVSLVGYPLHEGYPSTPMKKHLISYFATELGIGVEENHQANSQANAQPPKLPRLTLPLPPRPHDAPSNPYVTLQTQAGWSKYKEWAPERWRAIEQWFEKRGVPVVRIDQDVALPPRTIMHTIALIAHATLHLGIDSFANHITHYNWMREDHTLKYTPGVILFGSTQATASGYQDNTNITLNLHCQPCFKENPAISSMHGGPCINPPRTDYKINTPHACMNGIGVDRVLHTVAEMWEFLTRKDRA